MVVVVLALVLAASAGAARAGAARIGRLLVGPLSSFRGCGGAAPTTTRGIRTALGSCGPETGSWAGTKPVTTFRRSTKDLQHRDELQQGARPRQGRGRLREEMSRGSRPSGFRLMSTR
jgi:hypothetical protein